MPPRSSSPICERSLDLTLIEIGRRDIPQCSPKHFFMQMFYRTFSGGQRPRRPLMLWNDWWNLVCELRPACARSRTFLWMSLCLAGFSTRKDLLGVTSIVRALGLEPACYDRLLDFFH